MSHLLPRVLPICLALTVSLGAACPAHAQREPVLQSAPAVFLDTDPVAAKMLGAARDFLAARQWGDAVELLRQITDQHGERLVAIEPGRYVNVQTYADILIAGMPPEGLKLYRAKTDAQARRWLEAARKLRDEEGLERIVRKTFLSSSGDDALLLLGDLAWEQGSLARARSYWEKLLPPPVSPDTGEPPLLLKFPDSPIDAAQIKARLVLCSLMQGNRERAEAELAAFQESHPQVMGSLAGRHGSLAEILKTLLAASRAAPAAPRADPEDATFAGNPARNLVFPRAIDVGGALWSVPLREMRVERPVRGDDFVDRERPDRGPAAFPIDVLSYYPAVWNHIVFYCDDVEIFACALAAEKAGKAPWGNDLSLYKLPIELQQQPPSQRQRAGLPRFTMSIHRDRLYARLGLLAAPAGRNRGVRPPASVLVCLNLARQGDLEWMIKADELDADGGKWVFDGAPVAEGGRVYVTLRRNDPQLQLNVACFDASSARLLWNRKVCGGVEAFAGDVDEVRHQLLTLADERLYYCTNLGAVAALDARDGTVAWATTYPRVESENIVAFNRRQLHGPNPCLVHDGVVYATPTDGDRLLAYDAETGILKWDRVLEWDQTRKADPEHSGKALQLIGVSGGRLIAAGDMLWGLDTATGRVAWRDGRGDPEAATWGRGILAGGLVYWPRREEIRIVEIASGQVRRQIDLAEQHGLIGGGNLTIADDLLLLAQSDRLVAFSQFGVLKKPAQKDLVLHRGAGFQPAVHYVFTARRPERTETTDDEHDDAVAQVSNLPSHGAGFQPVPCVFSGERND